MSDVDVGSNQDLGSNQNLEAWIGKQQHRSDCLELSKAQAMAATLDWSESETETLQQGQVLPWPWHWLYFLEHPAASVIDSDGHPKKGGFLPPVSLPRRMWAGSRLQFFARLKLGDIAKKTSEIKSVKVKQGASGQLVFVTVEHKTFVAREAGADSLLVYREEQDIVYREAAVAGGPLPKPLQPKYEAQWSSEIVTDPVLLFRYSALTFNSHRIHYDRDYAIEQEAYQGLVVQGPLTASLLLNFLSQNLPARQELKSFEFKGLRPATGEKLMLQGRLDGQQAQLWALDEQGAMVMKASAELA